jgi:hypothetical protein
MSQNRGAQTLSFWYLEFSFGPPYLEPFPNFKTATFVLKLKINFQK